MSAMIEGLAGAVDLGHSFEQVELAPRWLAAGKDEADITIAYGPSGKYVHYEYLHNPQRKTITLTIQGASKQYNISQLLPVGKRLARLTIDGKTTPSTMEKIRDSYYVRVSNLPSGEHHIELCYK